MHLRKTVFVLPLAALVAILACGAAFAAVFVGRLAIEDQPFHSTMHTIEGSFPKFTDTTGKDRAERINDLVERFYGEVMTSASPKNSGGPYPPVRFAYDIFDSGRYLSILLHGSVNAGNTESHLVRTIVLDRRSYRILSLQDILGKDAHATAERFIRDEMRREPSRYLRDAKPPKAGDDISFYIDGTGNLVFIFDKYEIAPGSAGTPEMVYPAKNLPRLPDRGVPRPAKPRPALVSGRILDATMNTIVIQTNDGRKLSFSTMDADKSKSRGLLIGSRVDIFYTGTIEGTDTSKATVVRVRQPKSEGQPESAPTTP